MARRSNPWFSFESDNDDIDLDQDVLGTDTELDETAVDDAGDDSETVNVTPDVKETAHNELASAGGVVVGNNADQLEMDPVAASESFIRRFLGLSREDMEEAVDEITEKAETIPDADEVSATGDPELDDVLIKEEESGGEVVDADDTGVDDPALDGEVVETQELDTDEEAMEWYRSLEGDDGDDEGEVDDAEAKEDGSNGVNAEPSSEWWV